MDDLDHIGQYLQRESAAPDGSAKVLTKGHRVETRVADRFYTHCGRSFGPQEGTELAFYEFLRPEDRCLRC